MTLSRGALRKQYICILAQIQKVSFQLERAQETFPLLLAPNSKVREIQLLLESAVSTTLKGKQHLSKGIKQTLKRIVKDADNLDTYLADGQN